MEVVAAVGSAIVGAASTVATIATSALTTLGVPGAVASFAVQAAGQLALSAALAALTPKVAAEGNPLDWRADTDAGLQFPFGRVAAAGVINHRVAYDATNRFQSLFCTLAASGPIKSYISFAADDEPTTFDGTYNKAVDGEHSGFMWLERKLGTQPQTALITPTGTGAPSVSATGWTTAHDASGRAVYALTMFENSKLSEYRGGEVKPLHVIEGLYGYDPREDSTYPGGSGTCRINDPATWVYIEDPCIAALNWAIGRWEGDSGGGDYGVPYACSLVGGIGASLDGIDVAAFVNAANVSEANGWVVSAYPTSKDDKYEVLRALLQAGGALPSRKAGKISCITRGEEQASVLTVTAADTAGPVEVSLGQSRLERINTITPRFWSEANRWEMTPTVPVTDSDYLTEDGGIKRSRGVDYPYVPDADQAAQLAYYDIADAREAITGTVTFRPHMRRIEPGDCFTFSEPGFLLNGIKVKCLKRAYDPMSGVVKITFRQETDAKHAAALAQDGITPGGVDPETPPGAYVDPPTDFSATGAAPDVDLEWRNPVLATFDSSEVYRGTTATFGSATLILSLPGSSGAIETYSDTPGAGTWYYWVLATNTDGDLSAPVGPEIVTI